MRQFCVKKMNLEISSTNFVRSAPASISQYMIIVGPRESATRKTD